MPSKSVRSYKGSGMDESTPSNTTYRESVTGDPLRDDCEQMPEVEERMKIPNRPVTLQTVDLKPVNRKAK